MKKNIVIIAPLFLFPLMTCLSLSGMEKENQLTQELQGLKLFQKQQERHASGDYTEFQPHIDLVEPLNLIESIHETITIELPKNKDEYIAEEYIAINNSLLQSVILPTEEKEVSFLDWISYKTNTSYGHLQKMIDNLKKDRFDTNNLTHLNWLNEAIATANSNKDVESLLIIADLCESKYENKIRISEEVAQPAADLLNKYYTTQVGIVHEILRNERQKEMKVWNIATAASTQVIYEQINLYNQRMQAISKNYDAAEKQQLECISDLQRKMKTFSILNRNIRQNTNYLINNNQVKTPTHIFATTMKQTEKKLNSLQKTLEEIPTIKTVQDKYLENLINK